MDQTLQSPILILASSSPRRQELLRHLGLPFDVMPSGVDEDVNGVFTPPEFVELLAKRKAMDIKERLQANPQAHIVIGADTVVVIEDRILGKPQDVEDAKLMLQSLQGRHHHVYTGVCIVHSQDEKVLTSHAVTKVLMKPLSAHDIDNYVATGEPMDKAGAYAIQGIGATLIPFIEGDYFNVVGLPLSLLTDMLSHFHVHVPRSQTSE